MTRQDITDAGPTSFQPNLDVPPKRRRELAQMTEQELDCRMAVLCAYYKIDELRGRRSPEWYARLAEMCEIHRLLTNREHRRSLVYIIGTPTRAKIGTTNNLNQRVQTLRSHSPRKLRLIATIEGGVAEERVIHRRFADYREHGEWFRLEGELAAWIRAGCPL